MARAQAQIGLDDSWIKDDALLLEKREQAKDAKSAAVKTFTTADDVAKELLKAYDLTTPKRCGRFILEARVAPGHSVEFETQETTRTHIGVADAE